MKLYGILGLKPSATESEIKKAYYKLAKKYHPDKKIVSSSNEFQQINYAYTILINPKTREEFKAREKEFSAMYKRVSKFAETDIKNENEFVTNIGGLFLDKPYVANAKLIQLAFLDAIYGITPKKKQEEVWTDIVFLAIKKGNKFGPFGKLY